MLYCVHCAATADDGVQRSNNFDGRKTRLIVTCDPGQQPALPTHIDEGVLFPLDLHYLREEIL